MIRLKDLLFENTATADSISWAKKFKQDLNLTDEAAAAIAANIQHESGFIPDRIQGAGVKKGTLSDSGNLGYSWAQWTYGPRKKAFQAFIKTNFGVDISKTPATEEHAYAFLKHEMKQYAGFDFNSFKNSKNVNNATQIFVSKYEQAGKPMLKQRQDIARDILSKLKTNETETSKPIESGNLIGKTVYPLKKNGSVNVRSETYVDNGIIDNLIATVDYPKPVGYIKQVVKGEDGEKWYQVVLMNKELGYVKSDVVTTTNESQYEIKSGDTLIDIAKNNNTTVENILKKNPGLNANELQIGQKINI